MAEECHEKDKRKCDDDEDSNGMFSLDALCLLRCENCTTIVEQINANSTPSIVSAANYEDKFKSASNCRNKALCSLRCEYCTTIMKKCKQDPISKDRIQGEPSIQSTVNYEDNFQSASVCLKVKNKPKSQEVVHLLGAEDSDEYSMNYKNRGMCYIFNHYMFDSALQLREREGTERDVMTLRCIFEDLGFNVRVFDDLRAVNVINELVKAGNEDHTDNSCFVCCILTHGTDKELYAYDEPYPIEDIFSPFRGDVCPSLVGKPKVFVIQACQGKDPLEKVDIRYEDSSDAIVMSEIATHMIESLTRVIRIPTHSDFLVARSTIPGFRSWKNVDGSWFIQTLCAVLRDRVETKDVVQILTIVNRKVAQDREVFTPSSVKYHGTKQMPVLISTLTRELKFSF